MILELHEVTKKVKVFHRVHSSGPLQPRLLPVVHAAVPR
jgi:hypothetical protein